MVQLAKGLRLYSARWRWARCLRSHQRRRAGWAFDAQRGPAGQLRNGDPAREDERRQPQTGLSADRPRREAYAASRTAWDADSIIVLLSTWYADAHASRTSSVKSV